MSSVGLKQRRASKLPESLLGFGLGGLVAAVVLMFATSQFDSAPWLGASGVMLGAAAVVRNRRRDHPLSAWFCVMAGLQPPAFFVTDLLTWSVEEAASPWLLASLNGSLQMLNAVVLPAALRLFILFPDGRIRDRLERVVLRTVWLVVLLPPALLLTTPEVPWPIFVSDRVVANPFHAGPIAALLSLDLDTARVLIDASNLVLLVAVALLVRHYRRSGAADREQVRWLLLPVIASAFGAIAVLLFGWPAAVLNVFFPVVIVLVALALALGLLRPAGVSVDDLLRRSVIYSVLWLLIGAIYVGLSGLLGVTVGEIVSVEWAVTLTVIAMLALQPIRAAIERLTGRWLFGAPPDPRRAITGLGDSLAETYDLNTLLPQIATALEVGLGVEWARVRLTPGGPTPEGRPALSVPIELDGEALGVVECGPKLVGELDDEDAAVVATLARQAALAVRNVRLTTQLRDRTAELAASRARLIRAEEQERRRIERNIHDGVQQELVALVGMTGFVRRRLSQDGVVEPAELDELQSGLRRVLGELRELAAGIHPSLLRDHGLVTAVEALAARHPLPVSVRSDPRLRERRLPEEIEGAGYYTVAESLANSLKHADASKLEIEVSYARPAELLEITVADDGNGFDPASVGGNGLANLGERLATVGGRLTVSSSPGDGTLVAATISAPLHPESDRGDHEAHR